jgi:hypothetical protein
VQRVDHEGEVLVAEDVAVVAPQLVGNLALGMAVPASRGDVQVLGVEQDPRIGFLGRRRAFAWFLLDEIADRGGRGVDRFVETPSIRSGVDTRTARTVTLSSAVRSTMVGAESVCGAAVAGCARARTRRSPLKSPCCPVSQDSHKRSEDQEILS